MRDDTSLCSQLTAAQDRFHEPSAENERYRSVILLKQLKINNVFGSISQLRYLKVSIGIVQRNTRYQNGGAAPKAPQGQISNLAISRPNAKCMQRLAVAQPFLSYH
jgi:hypothetical protein